MLTDRQKLSVLSAVLFLALVAVAAWIGTGTIYRLAAGLICLASVAFLAIAVGFGLSLDSTAAMRLCGNRSGCGFWASVSGGLAHQIRSGVAAAKLAMQLHARSCSDGDSESLDVARRQLARVEVDLTRFLDLGRDDVP